MDPRANSNERLEAPAPLPHVSRRALRQVRHPAPIPTVCPYCRSAVELVNNADIYGREYGDWPYAYRCTSTSACGAHVGLHPNTDIPLGTLADKATRDARNACKKVFERLWREGPMTRKEAYAWLAGRMGITVAACHFGLFDAQQCHQARLICAQF